MSSRDTGSDAAFVARVVGVVRDGLDRGPAGARPRIAALRVLDWTKLNGLGVFLVRPDSVDDRSWEIVVRGLELAVYDDLHVDIWVTACDTADLRTFALARAVRETLTTNLPVIGDLDELRAAVWRPTAAYTAGQVRRVLGWGERDEASVLVERFAVDLADAPIPALLRLTATPPPTTGDAALDARIVEAVDRALADAGLPIPGWVAQRRS